MSKNSFVDKEEVVEVFLSKCNEILYSDNFNINKDFMLKVDRWHYSGKHTNRSTMIELGYEIYNVVNEIKSLSTSEYLETIIDNIQGYKNNFYCFIKCIQNRQVYIKIKIAEKNDKQIFCVSFHFAEYDIQDFKFPYKNKKNSNNN